MAFTNGGLTCGEEIVADYFAYARGGARGTNLDKVLELVAMAREAAAKAYEFSGGNAYAYAAVQACGKAAELAKRILGNGQN